MPESNFKSGFITIIGRPNVGKSTLLNALLKNKISIISPVPQTTRHQIKGILNLKNTQLVFVDTPGIHSFKDKLALHLNTIAKRALDGCDLIIYVVDATRKLGPEEEKLMDILLNQEIKIIMVLNKIDLNDKFISDYINFWENKKTKKDLLLYYLPLSAKTGKNLDKLKELLIDNLPYSCPYYDKGYLTDFPLKFRIADIIREKLFLTLKEELPHTLAVEVSEIEDKKKIVYIKANIYVQRDSQKKIVIGRRGALLKEIGQTARLDIEKILDKKSFLDIWVKVLADWQKSPRVLQELGYWWA
ncbi:MAG: GTPase Era [Candidatus Omnitrophica bacterium]|jgi:GTP-binding protein Era|nr:GTPase Era [Candidatus Omnitrophota bacterium]